jgi:hypothetical protein
MFLTMDFAAALCDVQAAQKIIATAMQQGRSSWALYTLSALWPLVACGVPSIALPALGATLMLPPLQGPSAAPSSQLLSQEQLLRMLQMQRTIKAALEQLASSHASKEAAAVRVLPGPKAAADLCRCLVATCDLQAGSAGLAARYKGEAGRQWVLPPQLYGGLLLAAVQVCSLWVIMDTRQHARVRWCTWTQPTGDCEICC